MATTLKTKLFIPAHQQSLFMLIFEETLISTYNVIPFFGPTSKENTCEIKFMYKTANNVGPSSMALDTKMAKRLVRENLHILKEGNSGTGKKLCTAVQQVIDLDDENSSTNSKSVRMVDLTKSDPEIITLDDSVYHSSNCSEVNVIDLDKTATLSGHKRAQSEVSVNTNRRGRSQSNISVSSTVSDSEIKVLRSTFKSNPTRFASTSSHVPDRPTPWPTRANRSSTPTPKKSIVPSASPIRVTVSSTRSKRKVDNIGNNRSPLRSIPAPSPRPKTTSDGVLKYYKDIAGVLDKRRKKSPSKKTIPYKQPVENRTTMRSRSPMKSRSPMRRRSSMRSRSSMRIKSSMRSRSPLKKINGKETQEAMKQNKVTRQLSKSPISRIQPKRGSRDHKPNIIGESNIFNPNPLVIDMEGLRPIVIDGSNVAIQHGKGKFSVKGVKICIDYFANRGHRDVKVFLPQYREEHFSEDLLKELREKCDIVFTPSRCINGVWKTSYDDRFIVQYAVEFGGVIVSMDNFRDLLRENHRWRKTIHERLLMFTWVDDFLMFPVDPLGRSGPTLEQFLRF